MDISTFRQQIDTDILNRKEPPWIHRLIHHGDDCLTHYKLLSCSHIAKKVIGEFEYGGIYAYFKGSDCLYIGKAKKMHSRVRDHLHESRKHENPKKAQAWYAFFNKYSGDIDLYLLPLGDESEKGEGLRQIVEIILTLEWKPTFLGFKENFKTK